MGYVYPLWTHMEAFEHAVSLGISNYLAKAVRD